MTHLKNTTGGGCLSRTNLGRQSSHKLRLTVFAAMLALVAAFAVPQAAKASVFDDLANGAAQLFSPIVQLFAGNDGRAVNGTHTADSETRSDYSWSLGNKSSTQYNGRVWTDKSVSTRDVTFTGDTAGETVTVPISEGDDASDFLVTYSALATSQQVSGESRVPVDVVFVIDLSGSMSNSDSFMDNSQRRIQNLVTALNSAVNELMEMNPDNRIGVVGYESTAMTILPLDHYTPSGYNQNIFSYSERSNRLSWDARNSSNQRVNDNTVVSGGTNTQMGIYQGMNMLATEADTTVTLEGGQEVSRVPSVIVMADGAATFSSDSSSWWSPSNNNNDGPGNGAYYGNGMKAMMTAAYMKQAIDRNYHPTDDAYKTTVYTIGIGTDDLSGDSRDLAYITLNPKDHWNDNNNMANSIRDKWNGVDSEWGERFDEEGYLSNNGTGTPNIDVDRRETYELTHPRQYDITEVGLQYNDAYYDAITAEDINTIFADIVDSISLGTPQVPTKVEGGNPVESGYITYTDVIGDYMEVDSVKTLLWAGKAFTNPQVSGEGTTDVTYTFFGEIQNPAYENAQNANQIQITVHTDTAADGTKTQTLTVKIPATAIPLRVNTVELSENAQGETTVVSNTSNNAYPLRLVYGVSLQDGIDPTTLEGVSDAYIADNTENGKVNFYSNKYSGNAVEGKTVGDAKVEFTPADNNPFYFLQEKTPIYTSQTGNDRVTRDNFNENATYWVPVTYYDGNQIVNTRVAREASTMTGYIGYEEVDSGWQTNEYACIRAGAPRLGNLTDVVRNKGTNTTNTAETSLYPTFEGDDVHNGKFVVYLGNNGKLQLDAPASLIIAKDVTADEGLTAPDATFTFEVTSEAKADSTVSATITTGSGQTATTEDTTIQFNADGVATVTLKADQSIELKGMAGADYSIKETNLPSGFDVVKAEGADETSGSGNDTVATGTVQTGAEDETVTFTNNYSVKSTTSTDLGINLGGTKTITGRSFQEDDTFTFTISAGRLTPEAPLPSDTDGGEDSVTIEPNSGDSATFEFDPITFTKPGEYCYIIRETDPTAGGTTPEAGLGGVDYDTAVYRISVVIVDNGDGTLRLATTDEIAGMATQVENYTSNPMLQELAGEGMTGAEAIQFDNSYSSESTTATIQGMKVLNVTNSDYKLQDGDFTFKIEALGSNTDGGDQFTADETQPIPVDQNGNELTQTTNVANGNVRFDFADDVFTQDMVGKTFGYKITEVNPSPEGSIMSNGVTYDTSEQIVKISVADDGQGNVIAQVTPNTADAGEAAVNFTFTNSYEPEEVTTDTDTQTLIKVKKTFTGLDWGEGFEFELKAVSNRAGINVADMPLPNDAGGIQIGAYVDEAVTRTGNFNSMTFKKAGEYTYQVTEKLPEGVTVENNTANGITYDTHTAQVTIKVSEDTSTGKLSVTEVSYDNTKATTKDDRDSLGVAAFTNTYDAEFDTSTAVNLDGTKNLTVRGNSPRTLGEGQFYAVVTALDGAPLGDAGVAPDATTYNIANTADDSVENGIFTGSFEGLLNNITFELSDLKGAASRDFVYLISEQQGNATGVTYDQSVYQVTVTVTNDGKGTLSASVPKIVKGTMQDDKFVADQSQEGVDGVVFNNSYEPTSGTYAPLKITKVLSGDRITSLQKGEFSFEMSVTSASPQDGIMLPQQNVVENAADGSVQFGNIMFTKAGTYEVQVREVVPAENSDERVPGVTYDEHVIKSVFTVSDNNGRLEVIRTGLNGSTTFTNVYTFTGATSANLSGTKYISGRDFMKGDTFTFDIVGAYVGGSENVTVPLPENVTASEENAAQGTITITPENGSSQDINFGVITFTKPGTYTYTLSEQNVSSDVKSVSKDDTVYTVTYTVVDDGDGTMTVSSPVYAINGAGEDADAPAVLTWTNVYKTGETKYDLSGIKKIEGRSFTEGDSFTFSVDAEGDSPMPKNADGDNVTSVTINPTKGTEEAVRFGAITFTEPGEYIYRIAEEQGDIKGMTYDTARRDIIITVTDDGQGNLSAELTVGGDQLVWTNSCAFQSVTFEELSGTKTMSGKELGNGQFTFLIQSWDGAPMGDTLPANFNGGATQNEDGTWTAPVSLLRNITFNKPGDYVYVITEVDDGQPGVTYDDTQYRVTLSVANDGTISQEIEQSENGIDWTDATAVAFANSYAIDDQATLEGSVNLAGTKTLQGRDWLNDDSFTFLLDQTAGDKDAVRMPAETAVVVQGNYSDGAAVPFVFGDIVFTEAGDYAFTISEQQPGSDGFVGNTDGMTYDDHVVTISVNVADNGEGKLEATVTDVEGSNSWTNVYKAGGEDKPGILSGAENLVVTKVIEGREWLDTDAFTFTLAADESNPDGVTMPAETTLTINANSENHQAAFGDITFANPGNYKFTVTETAGDIEGMTYDTTAHVVEVSVVDNEDGTLTASVVSPIVAKDLTFTNTYERTDGGQTPEGSIAIEKVLKNRAWDESDKFSFELTPLRGTSEDGAIIRPGNMPMPGNASVTMTKDNVDDSGIAHAFFGDIQFDEAGTYVYKVHEVNGGQIIDGVSYDSHEATVTITVTDNLKGGLDVKVDVADETFTNVYDAEETLASFTGIKLLVGRDFRQGDEFKFQVTPVEGAPLPSGVDASGTITIRPTSGGSANIDFGSIKIDHAGAYEYTIVEIEGSIPGIEYDTHTETVVFDVADNGEGGYSVSYQGEPVWENKYEAEFVVIGDNEDDLQVTKSVTGAGALSEFEFKLQLTTNNADGVQGLKDDNSITKATTGLTGTQGNETVDFGDLTFTKPGDYVFTVTETTTTTAEGWTYDNAPKTITVHVTDPGDGQLVAMVEGNNPIVTNKYDKPYVPPIEPDDPDETNPSKPDLDVDKTLAGRDMVAGEFSFTITATGDNADHVSPKTLTGTNDASGNVSFSGDGFKFDEAGEYTFTVSEVLPQDDDPETPGVQHNGVTYDETTYTITAKVTKGAGNKLVATWDLGSAAGGVTFANTYEPDETASVSLGATKVLNGRDLVAGEFTFELVDGQGNVVATATNAADGSVVFSPIEFTEAGTYTYLIREVAGSLANVTYDTATHTATVTVTDNGDGTLTATVLYDGSGTLPVFTNTYKVPEEPGEPDKPGKPTEPTKPSKPEEPQKPATPDTGDHTNAAAPVALALSGVALVAGAYVLRVRRNR